MKKRSNAPQGSNLRSKQDKEGMTLAETERLMAFLRGCCKGPDSLVEALERERHRDERGWARKRRAIGEKS
jgi:hypothetical protein